MREIKSNILSGSGIRLRALEPQDVEILYLWENDTTVWGVSHTLLPFSKNILRQFIEAQSQDIYQTQQTRFVIETTDNQKPVGVIDLFDFDPYNLRAGVGILVYDTENRSKGYAVEAIRILIRYGFDILQLHQIYCNIPASNIASQRLFEKLGFVRCGQKKAWLRKRSGWEDEYMYQLLNPEQK